MAAPSSLWARITPEELRAENLVLLPAHLVTDEQVDALVGWMRDEGARQTAEADALQAELAKRARRKLRVVP